MRLPFTIWRLILRELWRLVLLTTAVLIVITTFIGTIKPLADGLLSPGDALYFMVLGTPVMLQYVLPFAASFGATLAYHRLTSDNELLAAHAGGIGHARLLVPALASGLVLAGTVSALSEQLLPRLLRSMENLVTEPVTRIMVRSIEQGRSIEHGDMIIHADAVKALGPDERVGAYERLLLSGVAVVRLDKHQAIATETTALRAWMYFFSSRGQSDGRPIPQRDGTLIRVLLEGARGVHQEGDSQYQPTLARTSVDWIIPGAVVDRVKFLTWRELLETRRDPDRMNSVRLASRDLAHHMGERRTTDQIHASLLERGHAEFLAPDGRRLTVRAGSIALGESGTWGLVRAEPARLVQIEIDSPDGGGTALILRAQRAWFHTNIGESRESRHLSLRLELDGVTTWSAGVDPDDPGAIAGTREHLTYADLALVGEPLPDLLALGARELLARVDSQKPDPFLKAPTEDLRARLRRLDRELTGKRHERIATAVACLVMVLTGAVTAMRLGHVRPLVVYLWSFLPAAAAVVTINAGQETVRSLDAAGLVVVWAGVAVLAGYTLLSYRVVRRR